MAPSKRKAAAERFRARIHRSNELHASYLDDEALLAAYDRFTRWQLAYLLRSFDDMYRADGYREALDFVMNDLAGVGIAGRDWDLERVAPVITTMLPTGALQALASATRMNVQVLELNLAVTKALMADGNLPAEITERAYWSAFRQSTSYDECQELMKHTMELGTRLKSLVGHALLGGLLRAMRGPAHAAGFGVLQDFLELGFTTFRNIPDIDFFLTELDRRMTGLFDRILNAPLRDANSAQPTPSVSN